VGAVQVGLLDQADLDLEGAKESNQHGGRRARNLLAKVPAHAQAMIKRAARAESARKFRLRVESASLRSRHG
jgi:hypothetical protein